MSVSKRPEIPLIFRDVFDSEENNLKDEFSPHLFYIILKSAFYLWSKGQFQDWEEQTTKLRGESFRN